MTRKKLRKSSNVNELTSVFNFGKNISIHQSRLNVHKFKFFIALDGVIIIKLLVGTVFFLFELSAGIDFVLLNWMAIKKINHTQLRQRNTH